MTKLCYNDRFNVTVTVWNDDGRTWGYTAESEIGGVKVRGYGYSEDEALGEFREAALRQLNYLERLRDLPPAPIGYPKTYEVKL